MLPSPGRSERKGILLLQFGLLATALVAAILFFVRKNEATGNAKVEYVNSADKARYGNSNAPVKDAILPDEAESFYFDPNTADSLQLHRLGLSSRQISNIYKYRASGGIFHRPEEFKKLYGLTVAQWQHLYPLIRIAQQYQYLADTPMAYNPATEGYPQQHSSDASVQEYTGTHPRSGSNYAGASRDTLLYPNKLQPGQTIELNQADSTALKRIPGVGSYYAREIVRYRERLGGFSSLQQLNEVEDIPLGIEAYLSLDPSQIKPIKVNHATMRQLTNHPYINYYQAKVLTNHVRLFGPLHSFDELANYEEFTAQDFQRLVPYIDFAEF